MSTSQVKLPVVIKSLFLSNQGGGRFTQQWLTSLKEELKSAEPDWNNIAVGSVKEIPVENSVAAARDQKVQTPQMEVKVTEVALVDGNEENEDGESLLLSHNQPPLKPDEMVCAQQSAGWGTCYLGTAEEGGRKWSVFVEEKVWMNRWQGWYWYPGVVGDSSGHYIATTSDNTVTSILTLGYRYDRASVTFTVLPKRSYSFPEVTSLVLIDIIDKDDKLTEFRTSGSAYRDDLDATLSYSLFPELQIGLGLKRITLDYTLNHIIVDLNGTEIRREPTGTKYEIYGPTLNLGGQVCLANLIGVNFSMFGAFSYGTLKTDWGGNNNDYTRYHSTDLGLSWELQKFGPVRPELRLGYRAQTIYTEAPTGDAVDNTEGFTLGLRLSY